tara:strand:- start:224 stop:415 length:192 start_codon:yes stop_codon:yes gene_type:complete
MSDVALKKRRRDATVVWWWRELLFFSLFVFKQPFEMKNKVFNIVFGNAFFVVQSVLHRWSCLF